MIAALALVGCATTPEPRVGAPRGGEPALPAARWEGLASPLEADGTLLARAPDGWVAVDPLTGAVQALPAGWRPVPGASGAGVLVGVDGASPWLVGLDATTLAERWRLRCRAERDPGRCELLGGFAEGRVLLYGAWDAWADDASDAAQAVDPLRGERLWLHPVDAWRSHEAELAAGDGVVALACGHTLEVLDAVTGAPLWSAEASMFHPQVAVDGGRVAWATEAEVRVAGARSGAVRARLDEPGVLAELWLEGDRLTLLDDGAYGAEVARLRVRAVGDGAELLRWEDPDSHPVGPLDRVGGAWLVRAADTDNEALNDRVSRLVVVGPDGRVRSRRFVEDNTAVAVVGDRVVADERGGAWRWSAADLGAPPPTVTVRGALAWVGFEALAPPVVTAVRVGDVEVPLDAAGRFEVTLPAEGTLEVAPVHRGTCRIVAGERGDFRGIVVVPAVVTVSPGQREVEAHPAVEERWCVWE